MGKKYPGGLIHPSDRYRATTESAETAYGVWTLESQYQNRANSNWPEYVIPADVYPDDYGQAESINIKTGEGAGDSSSDYDVMHIDFDDAYAASDTGRLYIAINMNANTHFAQDFCLGAIQFTDNNYGTLQEGFSFDLNSDIEQMEQPKFAGTQHAAGGYTADYTDLETVSAIDGHSHDGDPQVWSYARDAPLATTQPRWMRASSSGSSSTGASGSVDAEYSIDDTGTIIGAATTTIAQATANYNWMYESSQGSGASAQLNRWMWTRTPEIGLAAGLGNKFLTIVYHIHTISGSNGMSDDSGEDTFRWFWVYGG